VIEEQLKRLERLRQVSVAVEDNMNTLASVDLSFEELCKLFQNHFSRPVRVILAIRMEVMSKTPAQEQVFRKLVKNFRFKHEIATPKAEKKTKKPRGGSCSLPPLGGFSLSTFCYT
jgi:histone deacetylase complex regulatory component SIN3